MLNVTDLNVSYGAIHALKGVTFNLKEGENPDSVEFNLVINGEGSVWIDDIHVMRRPLGRL